ncbi:MAG TPA: long-chain fatty acid--CoA ligase [Spirochaetia bacterium]|nr:long-chain fatty acid--CoA ligase [Spirochaetia bacterium]
MMDYPLSLTNILYRAKTIFPKKEVVSRDFSGIFRYTYGDMHKRVCQLANALQKIGIGPGERVASFAWNSHRHLELYFAVPCYGAVLNTVNIRLFRDHLIHCVNFAENKIMFIDEDLVPAIEDVQQELTTVKAYVIMTDKPVLPKTSLSPIYSYEELIGGESDQYEFPYPDEWSPAIMAYTTATTGFPKGVLYSHRGLHLHSLSILLGEYGMNEKDVSMPIVPMFHVNAWCRPFSDTLIGAKQVLPGSRPTVQDMCELIHNERVTFSAAVPTVWMGILAHVLENPGKYDFSCIRYLMSGGSALPIKLAQDYEEKLGIKVYQGYGQTETTPVTLLSFPKSYLEDLAGEDKWRLRGKTGLLMPGLEMRVVNDQGGEIKHDGTEMGELLLKGPWVLREYYKDPEKTKEAFVDGWFKTGDIVTVDEEAYVQVMDRTKDLIKSGGEWISSVDLENQLMGHPAVAEAAVIAIPHEKWQERPLACVVLKPAFAGKVTKEEMLDYLRGKVANWWLPDDVAFVAEIPKTSVGKFSKRHLREEYQAGKLK